MKKIILLIIVAAFVKVKAQPFVIDTIKTVSAYTNTYIPVPVYGKMRNGHIYTCGLNNAYTIKGVALPMQFVKIDMTSKTVTYKTLAGTLSSPSVLWRCAFDSAGNLYMGFNSNNRKIFRFNLKDSIVYDNLGNGFKDGNTLAYSMALGTDGHMYFGGSSGDPYVSEYDPATGRLTKYPSMDAANDYVLSLAADVEYIYAQTGQRNSIQLWEMKKSDSSKKLLFRITNKTRMDLSAKTDGIYLSFYTDTLSGIWKLEHGSAKKFTGKSGAGIIHYEINDPAFPPAVQSHFDDVENVFYYSINGSAYQGLHITAHTIKNSIRYIFGFKDDADNFYFAGDYYGNYYKYDATTNSSVLLGKTSFNIYSFLQDGDSAVYLGNYPSGSLLRWNRNKPWTLNKFINGKVVEAGKTSNPGLIGYFKSQTPAGFHHLEGLVKDYKGNIVGAGDVIRIGNTCSIAVYNPTKDSLYGYDYNRIKYLSFAGLAVWKNIIILSTDNFYGGTAKLYYYNSVLNKMDDSLNLGFADYGKIYIQGNILTGIANDRIYKLDLSTKKIVSNYTYKPKSILNSFMLSDGSILINTMSSLPEGVAKFIRSNYNSYWETKDFLYATDGNNLVRTKKPLN